MARLCRIQAALTTSPDVRYCLLTIADHYEAEGKPKKQPLAVAKLTEAATEPQ